MATYEEIARSLIADKILKIEQIYFYQNKRLGNVFEDIFRWCQEDLIVDNGRYKLKNSNFIYINDAGINAFAHFSATHQFVGSPFVVQFKSRIFSCFKQSYWA